MALSRRKFIKSIAILGAALPFASASIAADEGDGDDSVTKGANGLFVQPWFENSFLDLRDDLQEASDNKKQLILIFEQAGCPYCKELHKVNLQNPDIKRFVQANYNVVQLDIRGSREVTDFNGEVMEERKFANKWLIHFTPTLSFFPQNPKDVIGKSGRSAEAFRLTGYWKPFHFETVLRFVRSGESKDGNLQSYLCDRVKKLKQDGKPIEIWN